MPEGQTKVTARVVPRVDNTALRRYTPEAASARPHVATRQLHATMEGDARVRGLRAAPPTGSVVDMARAQAEGRLYRTLDGRMVELPEGVTQTEAAKLEREGLAAAQKLGRGPAPVPVPDVVRPPPKPKEKGPPPKGRAKPAARAANVSRPRSVGLKVQLEAVGGAAARYLVSKARPVLNRGVAMLGRLSTNEQTHRSAGDKRKQAEKAVEIPATEGQSRSNDDQVTRVDAKRPPVIDEAKGQRGFKRALDESTPRTIEDVDNFKRDMKGQHIGACVLELTQEDKNAVVGTFNEVQKAPPPTPREHEPEQIPAPEAAPGTAPLALGAAAIPAPLPEHTDVSRYTKEADTKLSEEGVTQEQLDMVDSGDLAEANRERKGMKQIAATEPAIIQREAKDHAARVQGELANEERVQRGALGARRRQGLSQANGKQRTAKSKLEKERDDVAKKINDIYQKAQDKVKNKLDSLEKESMQRFDRGNDEATKAFEDNVNRELEAYKDDRYSGWFGWTKRAKDWLLGMDELPRVKEIFETNRDTFVRKIGRLVQDIAADNKRVIAECKSELASAKTAIKNFVKNLKPALSGIGEKAANEMYAELEVMDGFIRQKEEQLQKALADKQKAAIKAIDQKIEKMKEAMSGALAKLGRLLIAAAKKFFTWALSKFGYSLEEIESIIDKGVAVLKAIFTQPIPFVKNLVRAAVQGFEQFAAHFVTHLKNAIFDWLGGELKGTFRVPSSWTLRGIVGVALDMLGISYANLRGKLVELMGEDAVARAEQTVEFVKLLMTEGIIAAWDYVQELGEEIKSTFVNAVTSYLQVEIIIQAVATAAKMLIPGAGLVKAIVSIYKTIVFLVQRAKQIASMIADFLGSIAEIAAGNIAAAADAMENGLARGLSLVIGFLASAILNLSGVGSKVAKAIGRVRAPVDKVMLNIAKRVAGTVRTVVGKAKEVGKDVFDWVATRARFKDDEGATHTVYIAEAGPPQVMVASQPQTVVEFIHELEGRRKGLNPDDVSIAKSAAVAAADLAKEVAKAKGKTLKNKQRELLELNIVVGEALSRLLTNDRKGGKLADKYALEGMTGTYNSMPRMVGDSLTPDHQPQAAIVVAAAAHECFKGDANFKPTKIIEHAANRAAAGYAINLFHTRHVAGRTYGGNGKTTLADFKGIVATEMSGLTKPHEKREKLVKLLKKEVKADADQIKAEVLDAEASASTKAWKDLCSGKDGKPTKEERETIRQIKARIKKGEELLKNQPLEALLEPKEPPK